MPRITNGGPERARKRTLGEREGRSCKHRIKKSVPPEKPSSLEDSFVFQLVLFSLFHSIRLVLFIKLDFLIEKIQGIFD